MLCCAAGLRVCSPADLQFSLLVRNGVNNRVFSHSPEDALIVFALSVMDWVCGIKQGTGDEG